MNSRSFFTNCLRPSSRPIYVFLWLSLALLLFARPVEAQSSVAHVPARGETAAGGSDPDDNAIWLHPSDTAQSLVIGADTVAGLTVYDLNGAVVQAITQDGGMNNLDVRYNFPLGSERVSLVIASNLSSDTISIYKVNVATRQLENIAARRIPLVFGEPYGLCLYHSPTTGKYYAFPTSKSGVVEQWELFATTTGKVDATLVRSFDVGQRAEGCVADDVTGQLYLGEDDVAIWKYGAEPNSGSTRSQIDTVGGGRLVSAVEGLTLYYKSDGTGYLLASSQGSSTFIVYRREGANGYLGTFDIVAATGLDAVSSTDGIDVTNLPLNSTYTRGLLVAHDSSNEGGVGNFKYVSWQALIDAFTGVGVTTISADVAWDARLIGAGSGGETPTPIATTATDTPTPLGTPATSTPVPTTTTPTPPTPDSSPTPISSPTPVSTAAFLEQGGTVVIEAESFNHRIARSGDDWQTINAPAGYSGAAAMVALPNNGGNIQSNITTTSPEMIYQVQFVTTGTYNFWVRAVGPSGSDDSIHVGTDGVVRASPSLAGSAWFWKKAGTVTIGTTGLHTIHIWMREDGTSLDKLLLTTAATTPSGTGPAESPRAGGGGGNLPPSVAISSPINGNSFVVNSIVNLSATASDPDGAIAQVIFAANGLAICTDTSAPYTCAWTPTATGNVAITASASDNNGALATSAAINVSITAAPNNPPSVALTAPANGTVGTPLNLSASASDSDGSIANVVFRLNGSDICTDTSAPYTCAWTPNAAGSFNVMAVATDNNGAATSTAAATVAISGGTGGTGAFLEQGGTVVIEAENFHSKTARSAHDWQTSTATAGFSGAGAMSALPNSGSNLQSNIETTSPEMLYQVQFATTGTYNFWLRAVGPTGSDDSLHVGLDGVVRASPSVSGAAWFWKKAGSVTITTAGVHTVHIWMREDGAAVDKLLLTKATTTPSGVGPGESPRGSVIASAAFASSEIGDSDVAQPNAAGELILSQPEDGATLPVGQSITLAAQIDGANSTAWHIAFLVNDQVIDGCDADGISATCQWTPGEGEYLLQVVANGDGTLASTTTLITVGDGITVGNGLSQRAYLPLITK